MDINTNSTLPSNLSDTFSSKASQTMQEQGIEVIQKTQSNTEQSMATNAIEPTKQQKNGIEALMNDLGSNLDDTTKKELLKKDIELYSLSQDMINQAIEKFADGNQEKYVQSKVLLGSNMGFDLTA